jgi:hypothetical protein
MTNHWYDDHLNLAAVARAMIDSLDPPYDVNDVLYMLEKPGKYTDIYLQTVIPEREAAGVPARSGQHNLKKADFVELFAKGDRVVRRSGEDTPLNHVEGTVMTGSSPAQSTAAVVVHWDRFGPDHLVTVDPSELRKVRPASEFAVGDRVVKVSDDGRPLLGRWTGTVKVPTIEDGFVGVHWDGWAPDHFDATDHNDLRKVDN